MELGFSAAANQEKQPWKTWIGQEEPILTQLENLREYTRTPPPDWIVQRFRPDLRAITQQTTNRVYPVAERIGGGLPLPGAFAAPDRSPGIAASGLRLESRGHPVAPLVAFSALFAALKAIAQHFDQALKVGLPPAEFSDSHNLP
ncbi:MAG: hypothetical protein EA368_01060 [Leptolyngbya sp. DLM2.Bin27]|nr:MAG: hypothetical protein EA368_01060 [Leptolyngbya sp. DLM2.Bin27]